MLVLFETAAGFSLFKVLDEGKLKKADNLWEDFESPEKAKKVVALKSFSKFANTADALASATAIVESKVSKDLKSFLKKHVERDVLAVTDPKLGVAIKDALGCQVVSDSSISELVRGIRYQFAQLVDGLTEADIKQTSLGLSHSLSRYKLKFSPDKVDTMIVQAIALLDDMDKELNIYAMRVREWYGWHFPELGRIITDNISYARLVKHMGARSNAGTVDLNEVLPEESVPLVKEAAAMSMGTEVSQEDIDHITELCNQVIEISKYREELDEYLKTRMQAIAPNLTELVGVLLGARLIARAGNLMNLAKYPASTVQILGAEKALFRSLKTRAATPKYGLLYNASLVTHATAKNKGKISRVLAAKTSLSVRVDALGESDRVTIGIKARAAVERRLKLLEAGGSVKASGKAKKGTPTPKYDSMKDTEAPALERERNVYDTSQDLALTKQTPKKPVKQEESSSSESEEEPKPKKQKTEQKKEESSSSSSSSEDSSDESSSSSSEEDKKKSKKRKKGEEEKKEETKKDNSKKS